MAQAVTYCPGLNPLDLIRGDNDLEFALLERVVERAALLQKKIRKEQAALIINALSESLNKGSKRTRSEGSSSSSTA